MTGKHRRITTPLTEDKLFKSISWQLQSNGSSHIPSALEKIIRQKSTHLRRLSDDFGEIQYTLMIARQDYNMAHECLERYLHDVKFRSRLDHTIEEQNLTAINPHNESAATPYLATKNEKDDK